MTSISDGLAACDRLLAMTRNKILWLSIQIVSDLALFAIVVVVIHVATDWSWWWSFAMAFAWMLFQNLAMTSRAKLS